MNLNVRRLYFFEKGKSCAGISEDLFYCCISLPFDGPRASNVEEGLKTSEEDGVVEKDALRSSRNINL